MTVTLTSASVGQEKPAPWRLAGEVLHTYIIAEDGDDVSYMWFNTPEEDGVTMELTFFVRAADGRYDRFEETHRQYAHREEDVLSALRAAGFSAVGSEGDLGTADKSLRINFTAIKGNKRP